MLVFTLQQIVDNFLLNLNSVSTKWFVEDFLANVKNNKKLTKKSKIVTVYTFQKECYDILVKVEKYTKTFMFLF